MQKFILTLLFFFTVQNVNASTNNTDLISALSSGEDFNYPDYYQINEDASLQNINLLALVHFNVKFPMPATPYKRDIHFGGWLRDKVDGTCLNTRGKVLVRDSATNVNYTANGCTVDTGEWNDLYTAKLYTSSGDIQIDHVVALKNAYMTGAHQWDFKKRCLYANFLGNNFHLLAVNGKENMKKSDHSPEGYVPPNKKFTCDFIKTWLNIKLIWTLRVTPNESAAISQLVNDNNCSEETFTVKSEDLAAQRNYMAANAELCVSKTAFIEQF